MDVFFEQHKPTSSIANFLATGSKRTSEPTLGFELEHFVVEKESNAFIPFSDSEQTTQPTVEAVLERLKGYYTNAVYEQGSDGQTHLFGLERPKAVITLEPGAQLEISVGPAHTIGEIEQHYLTFRSEIDPVLDEMGLKLLTLGYHPTSRAADIPLLPKMRYKYMNDYFAQTGDHGICMMRASASTQVSIDFENEDDAIRKLRIANALSPFFAFITDNAPVFETQQIGYLNELAPKTDGKYRIPHRMVRMAIWDDTDPKRCLITKGAFDEDFSFLRYAEALMEAPGIFLPATGLEGGESKYLGFTTFGEALPNEFINEELVLHILSLFFFDTRIKTYLEIRPADSLPLEYALAFTALVSGVLYNQEALDYYTEKFLYTELSTVAFAKTALRTSGYDAKVYGRPAHEWLDELISFARDGLSPEDAHYLEPLASLIINRKTLLDL